jgi:hypothetical protein
MVRSNKARALRIITRRKARKNGHDVALISDTGALELYGCLHQGCPLTFEIWDSPEIVCGNMQHTKCSGQAGYQRKGSSLLKRFLNRLGNLFLPEMPEEDDSP